MNKRVGTALRAFASLRLLRHTFPASHHSTEFITIDPR